MIKLFPIQLIILFLFINVSFSCANNNDGSIGDEENISVTENNDISQFLGQWTFDIGDGGIMNAGWLNVRQEDGYIDADLMWGGGGIFYGLPYVYVSGDVLYLGRGTRNIDLTNNNDTFTRNYPTWIELSRDGDTISGYYIRPRTDGMGADSIRVSGTKSPTMPPAPDLSNLNFGEPVNLIPNPNDLTGWTLIEDHLRNGWSVEDGVLRNDPGNSGYGNLRTVEEFEDFELILEVKVPPNGNSGVYLRGMHEVQISDSYGSNLNWGGSMGAIFTRVAPTVNAEKPPEEWQTMEIIYYQRHATVTLNGVIIVDNQPVEGVTGGAMQSDVTAPGPIYLQGDHTAVSYRNMILTPIIN
ncbi:MAG: DUF1080 domain-containing protein [Balneolaceae bacterium]|nr:DUF1080 domain-containing protein [Balneolaceae bacterium]